LQHLKQIRYFVLFLYKDFNKKGETTWEPKESFIDEDGTKNDIYQKYNYIHPIKQTKKRKRESKKSNSSKKQKKSSPRATKSRRSTQ